MSKSKIISHSPLATDILNDGIRWLNEISECIGAEADEYIRESVLWLKKKKGKIVFYLYSNGESTYGRGMFKEFDMEGVLMDFLDTNTCTFPNTEVPYLNKGDIEEIADFKKIIKTLKKVTKQYEDVLSNLQ